MSDHEAATICATPMLLQFLLALLLSWRTKFGGNLRIKDDMPKDCLVGEGVVLLVDDEEVRDPPQWKETLDETMVERAIEPSCLN